MSDKKKQGDQRLSNDEILQNVKEALQGLKFGSIHITVQDGVIVQIDRTEKQRFCQPRGD